MNIFYLDKDPVQAAVWMVDKHVVKMILESAQLLSTAHRVIDGIEIPGKSATGRNVKRWHLADAREPVLYSATHINHPSAVWCRQSVENYNWLADHMFALLNEYTHRYGKHHKVEGDLSYMLQSPPHNLKEYDMTVMPSAMADEYKIGDEPVINYRNYYKIGKARMHKWTNRQPPEWINEV
jgi:hypothetical protein